MGQKLGRGLCPLFEEGAGSPSNTHKVAWAEAYLRAQYQCRSLNAMSIIILVMYNYDCFGKIYTTVTDRSNSNGLGNSLNTAAYAVC